MQSKDPSLVASAARAARRFQLMASLHLARPHRRALAREGQAVINLLWQMGFRPGKGE